MNDGIGTANNKFRVHSNTISGGRPPALEIPKNRPPNIRRNSDGSPGLPPPIQVSEPTPIEPSEEVKRGLIFNANSTNPASNNDRPLSVASNNESVISNASAASKTSGTNTNLVADSAASTPKKKSRSRASSVTSNLLSDLKENPTIHSITSKIRSRQNETDNGGGSERTSFDVAKTAPSIALSTGVNTAAVKRNQDFHALFRSVPEDDNLVEDYGCALQKEILLQGRIYISENHVCFNANIFGWVTNLVIAFADITEIEKKTTAIFIPNAIQISTDSSKFFFASFLSRDQAYDLMVKLWRNVRPEPLDRIFSGSSREENSDLEYESDTEDSYSSNSGDLDTTDTDDDHVTQGIDEGGRKVSLASLPVSKESKEKDAAARRRAVSEAARPTFQSNGADKLSGLAAANGANGAVSSTKAENETSTGKAGEPENVQVNEKTQCDCATANEHYSNVVLDQIYSSTLPQIYNLFYDSNHLRRFLVDNQKTTEVDIGEWKKGEGSVQRLRELSYIKPLNGAIGPKQTKCIITQEVLHEDPQVYITVLDTTSTPDVPSGGSFSCKTRTCFSWAGKGKVRVLVTCQVEFTKSSWLKSTIEKASIDGQQTYYKDLDAVIRAALVSDADSGRKSEGRRKRRTRKARSEHSSNSRESKPAPEPPKSLLQRIIAFFSSNDLMRSNNGTSPTTQKFNATPTMWFIITCMFVMVCINMFIAMKMADVEKKMIDLLPHALSKKQEIPENTLEALKRNEIYKEEEDDLWRWLDKIDINKKKEQPQQKLKSSPVIQGKATDKAAQEMSKLTKERLEKQLEDITAMIKKTEVNLNEVTQAYLKQREKISKMLI